MAQSLRRDNREVGGATGVLCALQQVKNRFLHTFIGEVIRLPGCSRIEQHGKHILKLVVLYIDSAAIIDVVRGVPVNFPVQHVALGKEEVFEKMGDPQPQAMPLVVFLSLDLRAIFGDVHLAAVVRHIRFFACSNGRKDGLCLLRLTEIDHIFDDCGVFLRKGRTHLKIPTVIDRNSHTVLQMKVQGCLGEQLRQPCKISLDMPRAAVESLVIEED